MDSFNSVPILEKQIKELQQALRMCASKDVFSEEERKIINRALETRNAYGLRKREERSLVGAQISSREEVIINALSHLNNSVNRRK